MDWGAVAKVAFVGYGLIVVQAIEAWRDGRLWQGQMKALGLQGYAMTQHGGVAVADVFLITSVFAYLAGLYRFDAFSWRGLISFAVVAVVTRVLMQMWQDQSVHMGDHCTHDGVTVPAGWIHGLYFMLAVWAAAQVYLGWTTPVVGTRDLLLLTVVLSFFWPLGVMKFDPRWYWDSTSALQVMGGIIGTWAVALFRIWRS